MNERPSGGFGVAGALLKVFVSSTSRGLQPYRAAVCTAIGRMDGFHCVNMEQFGARSAAPLDWSLAQVRQSDIFVGIIGPSRGDCPLGDTVSFTEHEYNEAVLRRIERLVFVTPDNFPVRENEREDDKAHDRQQAFRERVRRELVGGRFDALPTPDGLAIQVATSLANHVRSSHAAPPLPAVAVAVPRFGNVRRSFSWRRSLAAVGAAVGIALLILIAQHIFVATHRLAADQVAVPGGTYRTPVDDSPLLTLMRQLGNVGDLDSLVVDAPRIISLPSFWLDRSEVTNAGYDAYLAGQRRSVAQPAYATETALSRPDQPVVGVDWTAADAYCRAQGKRLPSGDEWERAARGRNGRLYPWGNVFRPQHANTLEGPMPTPAPVGSYPDDATPEGVMDLGGNVREWIADQTARREHSALHYIRGASFKSRGDVYGLAFLSIPADEDFHAIDLGFRCAADDRPGAPVPAGMVLIPAGSFQKGSEDQRLLNLARKFDLNSDSIRRLINIPGQSGHVSLFGMDRNLVTNMKYREFLTAMTETHGSGRPQFDPDRRSASDQNFNDPNQPVVGVT